MLQYKDLWERGRLWGVHLLTGCNGEQGEKKKIWFTSSLTNKIQLDSDVKISKIRWKKLKRLNSILPFFFFRCDSSVIKPPPLFAFAYLQNRCVTYWPVRKCSCLFPITHELAPSRKKRKKGGRWWLVKQRGEGLNLVKTATKWIMSVWKESVVTYITIRSHVWVYVCVCKDTGLPLSVCVHSHHFLWTSACWRTKGPLQMLCLSASGAAEALPALTLLGTEGDRDRSAGACACGMHRIMCWWRITLTNAKASVYIYRYI